MNANNHKNVLSIFGNMSPVLVGVTLALASTSLQAANIRVKMTVDNSFALYTGTQTAATNYVITDTVWQTVATFDFTLTDAEYLYVVTQSDLSAAQGFLVSSKTWIPVTSFTAKIPSGRSWQPDWEMPTRRMLAAKQT